ncbi:unnamed protein product [Aphanomyces euteiches]|uniref:BTB domain-containing protein n=1 Tax=Aphanomyces euteiches TaxID=100861 RepID=A0A6G0X363_9STRA|nr:hypothetical protein Ae201684_008953 [Aphanomyces euteiches]KAH9154972.1 hypothetical protein AeRB84_003011 [Aphanomyces euteiches]
MALYVWGKNCACDLQATEREKTVVYPTFVEHFGSEVIMDFAAGENHALAVTEFGDVYSWGRGKDGELGQGEPREDITTPTKIKSLEEHIVVNVSCGNIHSMATTITGQVYMWGLLHDTASDKDEIEEATDGASGMLVGLAEQNALAQNDPILARVVRDAEAQYREGTNEVSDFEQGMDQFRLHRGRQSVPRLATSLVGHFIIKVSAGSGHNLALSSKGEVFSCGYNEHGQLGLGHSNTVVQFEKIKAFQGLFVEDIVCGQQHNLALVRLDGVARCFTWGLGALGQLGHGTRRSFAVPKLVQGILDAIVSVGAGSHHSAAVDSEGRVYTWGHSEYGQHGVSYAGRDLYDPREYFIPRQQMSLADVPMVSVCCGSHFTLSTSRDGKIYSWGWNSFGVLGLGHFLTTTAPQWVESLNGYNVTRIMAGYNQSGAIVQYVGSPHAMNFRSLVIAETTKMSDITLTLPKTKVVFPVHKLFLKARCPFLYGYVRSAVASMAEEEDSSVVALHFPDLPLDAPVLKAVLTYLYTDRLDVAAHKIRALIVVSEAFGLGILVARCEMRAGLLVGEKALVSSFATDMAHVALQEDFADVWFTWPSPDGTEERIPAHQVILNQVDYFATMLSGRFRESSTSALSMAGMAADGMRVDMFKTALKWLYTGSRVEFESMELDQVVPLLIMANMLGLDGLVNVCTNILSKLVASAKSPDVTSMCWEIADSLNLQRLKIQCDMMLQTSELVESKA